MLDAIEVAGWSYEPVGDRGAQYAQLVDNTGLARAIPHRFDQNTVVTAFQYFVKYNT